MNEQLSASVVAVVTTMIPMELQCCCCNGQRRFLASKHGAVEIRAHFSWSVYCDTVHEKFPREQPWPLSLDFAPLPEAFRTLD